jgi:glycerophosphoryl diester phosphodiesterase
MQESAKDIWSRAVGRLLPAWRSVVFVHLFYTIVAVALVAPLIGLVARLALALTGNEAVADQDIAGFLLSPIGLAALVLVAALSVIIVVLEQCSLMAISAAGMQGDSWTARDGLAFAAARARRTLSFAIRLVARVLAIVLPFLAVGAAVALLLLDEYDINFYLSQRPPEFIATAVIVALLAMAALLLLGRKLLDWALALPLIAFAATPPGAAFAASTRHMHGRRRTLLIVLLKWAAVAIVLGFVVVLGVQLLASAVLPAVESRIRLLLPVLGVLATLWLVGNFLATAFNAGAFAEIITDVYERCGPLPDAALDRSRIVRRVEASRLTTRQLAIGVATAALLALGLSAWFLHGIRIEDQVEIVAHRGAAGAAPENTMAAVRRAIEDGTDWVEIDVQESADGAVVVVHDSDFMKLAGEPLKVWNGTLDEIREIDVGSWFSPVFRSERVPTLQEVLAAAKGRSKVVIELKYYGHDVALERKVVEIVEEAGMADQVAIMSLKYEGIQQIRELRPDWTIGLLSAKALGDLTSLDADFLAVNMGMARAGFLRRARRAGKPVFVWTVNTPVDVSRMASLGVSGIITDEPAMARQVLEDRAEMTVGERLLIHTAVLFGRDPPKRYRDDSP